MSEIIINPLNTLGKIKPMHCINGGPLKSQLPGGQDNRKEFSEIEFPYIRNHDVSFVANFGMEHVVDVSAIFPDFSKNAYSESSYDFTLTDEYISRLYEVGSKPFYRLGQKIEHWSKKYGSNPPSDFQKWAVICEHIIKHYTEGWNNGFRYDMEYWEIWNEPDNIPACWTETLERFYELYEITATHLKNTFPNLKIGGPAFAEWSVDNGTVRKFIEHMSLKNVPIDFLSWHTYSKNIEDFTKREREVRSALNSYGYTNTESILDEWNYLVSWENLIETQQNICSISGAALTSAVMCVMQNTSLDMLMYYTVQPGTWNGLFDFYTLKKLKSYFVFLMF